MNRARRFYLYSLRLKIIIKDTVIPETQGYLLTGLLIILNCMRSKIQKQSKVCPSFDLKQLEVVTDSRFTDQFKNKIQLN